MSLSAIAYPMRAPASPNDLLIVLRITTLLLLSVNGMSDGLEEKSIYASSITIIPLNVLIKFEICSLEMVFPVGLFGEQIKINFRSFAALIVCISFGSI